jgi:putative Mg2+ transporter-C (MgtC) family protein
VRALIVQHTAGLEVILRGIRDARADDSDDVRISARVLVDGDAQARLERLVARLGLEPGIRDVHWHAAEEPVASVPEPDRHVL